MVEIPLGLGLARKVFFPVPLVEQLWRERVAVSVALRVEAGPGIAVPVPGTADPTAGLEYPHPQAKLAQLIELGEPGNAGADDDGIKVGCCIRLRCVPIRRGGNHAVLPSTDDCDLHDG